MAAFISVKYVDPFAPLPIGQTQAGVQAALSATGVPTGQTAYAQLVADLTPIAYGTGATATSVRVLNTVPLAPTMAYVLQVQFAAPGANPANLDWTSAGVISSPVIVQQLRITNLAVTPTGLSFAWETPSGAALAGGFLQIIDATNNALTAYYYLGVGPAASVAATFTAGHVYQVCLSAVQPITGGTAGAFSAPYTTGPATTQQAVPTAAPNVTRATYQGDEVSVQWTAPTAPANAPAPSYDLVLLDGANVVAVAPAGPAGGQLVSGQVSALAQPAVAARTRYSAFVGPVGAGAALSVLAPRILGVTLTGGPTSATITAQLASPGPLPTGGALVGTLYANGVAGATQSLSAATGTVAWTALAPAATTIYEIDVVMVTTVSGLVVQGPRSPRVATPLTAPQSLAAAYDGQTVTVDLAFAAANAADGYTVALSGSGGAPAQTFSVGAQLPISFPANLDVSKTWTATVTPSLGLVSALNAATTVALPTIAAPALTSVVYDGEALSLQWSAATLPFLDSYTITLTNGPTAVTAANQTACVLPLTPAQAAGATVTVTGVSPLRSTAASSAVAVLTNLVEITSVQVSTSVVAAWTASGSPPAMRAELLIGDTLQSVVGGATATGVSFTTPTATSQPYRLRARAVSADGVAAGPLSATINLLLTAPALISGELGDGQASLRWSPVSPPVAASYGLNATPASGAAASLLVTGDAYDGPVPTAFSAAGTLKITPISALCSGPALSIPVNAPGAIASAVYDGSRLTVTANVGSGHAGDIYWFDVLTNGAQAARTVVAAAGAPVSTQVVIPVALAQGASAAMRMIGVGPASLTPPSPLAAIPTVTPIVLSATYDGTNLHVAWTPTPGPGVDGYVVSVANASVSDTYVAGGGSFLQAIPATLTYPFATNIVVTVRAASGAPNAAPYVQGASSLAIPPTLAGHALSAGVVAAGNPPYLYRRGSYQTLADVTGKPIVLYLPKPFTGTDNPTIPASGATSFALAPAAGSPPLPYQLTLGADVWTTLGSAPVRPTLRDTYVAFLSAVEDAGVYPWALGLIRQIIAQAMPQTFEEVLYYRYGLWRSDSLRVVDLTPGTRLQVSNAVYQAIVGGTSAKNGFLATGAETMDLVDAIPQGGAGTLPTGSGRSLSVDSFLSLLYPGGGGSDTGRPVAAGPIDFFDGQNRQPCYRLFYPPTPFASGSNGSTALQDNVTVIGAMSWKTLSAVTDSYAQTGTFPTGQNYFATYFRGRASISPLINVNIQGEQRWATLGTSVRQALSAQGLAPYFGGGGQALSMVRASANLFDYSTASLGLTLDPVNLGNQDMGGVTPLYWPLDMPLVGGDQVGLRQI